MLSKSGYLTAHFLVFFHFAAPRATAKIKHHDIDANTIQVLWYAHPITRYTMELIRYAELTFFQQGTDAEALPLQLAGRECTLLYEGLSHRFSI